MDTFNKLIVELYKKENSVQTPPNNIIKSIFEYIDIRKDGILDINEWSKSFDNIEVINFNF